MSYWVTYFIVKCLLYYEGKVKKTVFLHNFGYVLRTTITGRMVSFIDFCPFSSKFSDLNFASYVLYIYPFMSRDTQ